MHRFISFFFILLGTSVNLIAQNDEADVSVEEVIVTATSRESTVLDVPYNISTISGNEITFAIWTYNQTQTTSSLIFLGDTGASPGNGRILNIHSLPYSGNMYYFDKGYDGTGYDRLSGSFSNTTLHTGWTHWVFTSNASTGSMKMYRNGTLFDSSTGNTKTLTNANGNLRRIARNNGSQCVGAWISNLQLYKKELSAFL